MRNFSDNQKKIIVSILCLVIVILVGVLIYANFFANTDNKEKELENIETPKKTSVSTICNEPNNENVSDENYVSDDDGNKKNISEKIKETHKLSNNELEIQMIEISTVEYKKSMANLKFNIFNNSDGATGYLPLRFKFYSKSGELLSDFVVVVSDKVNQGEFLTIDRKTCSRVIDAYDFTVEVDNEFKGGAGG